MRNRIQTVFAVIGAEMVLCGVEISNTAIVPRCDLAIVVQEDGAMRLCDPRGRIVDTSSRAFFEERQRDMVTANLVPARFVLCDGSILTLIGALMSLTTSNGGSSLHIVVINKFFLNHHVSLPFNHCGSRICTVMSRFFNEGSSVGLEHKHIVRERFENVKGAPRTDAGLHWGPVPVDEKQAVGFAPSETHCVQGLELRAGALNARKFLHELSDSQVEKLRAHIEEVLTDVADAKAPHFEFDEAGQAHLVSLYGTHILNYIGWGLVAAPDSNERCSNIVDVFNMDCVPAGFFIGVFMPFSAQAGLLDPKTGKEELPIYTMVCLIRHATRHVIPLRIKLEFSQHFHDFSSAMTEACNAAEIYRKALGITHTVLIFPRNQRFFAAIMQQMVKNGRVLEEYNSADPAHYVTDETPGAQDLLASSVSAKRVIMGNGHEKYRVAPYSLRRMPILPDQKYGLAEYNAAVGILQSHNK